VTGLSATVTRKDGHHPIIFMQCGPVRYRVDDRKQAAKRPFFSSVQQDKPVAVLGIILVLEGITREPKIPDGSIDINTKTLIARSHPQWRRARFSLLGLTIHTEIAGPDCKRKIVAIKEGRPFDLKNRLTQLSRIMPMSQQNILIASHHFNTFLISCIPNTTSDCTLKEVLTAPPTLQQGSDVKTDVLRGDNSGILHIQRF